MALKGHNPPEKKVGKRRRGEQNKKIREQNFWLLTYQISNSVGSSNETKYQKSCDAQLEREGKEDGFLEKALKHSSQPNPSNSSFSHKTTQQQQPTQKPFM